MTDATERLKMEIARLPVEEKDQLLSFLLWSMEEADPEAEAAWDEELARREEEIRNGQASHSPIEEVFDHLHKKWA